MKKPPMLPILVGLILAASTPLLTGADIPPSPADEFGNGDFIHDFAGLLTPAEMDQIRPHQQTAMEQHNTPIVVVTVRRMADYGHDGDIASLAKLWFNAWNVGTLERESGANLGVLVLVSVGDRKARIELGGDWGRKRDDFCQQVMSGRMVPSFKEGDYAGGITNAVASLSEMAAAGPDGAAPQVAQPSVSMGRRVQRGLRGRNSGAGGPFTSFGILPVLGIAALFLGGMVLIVAGIFVPEYRKWLIGAGLMMIVAAICFPVVVLVLVGLGAAKGGMGGSSSGGSSSGGYSGGGFSGGYSGGGGASGSW